MESVEQIVRHERVAPWVSVEIIFSVALLITTVVALVERAP